MFSLSRKISNPKLLRTWKTYFLCAEQGKNLSNPWRIARIFNIVMCQKYVFQAFYLYLRTPKSLFLYWLKNKNMVSLKKRGECVLLMIAGKPFLHLRLIFSCLQMQCSWASGKVFMYTQWEFSCMLNAISSLNEISCSSSKVCRVISSLQFSFKKTI